jgi:hypothetical protein
VRQIACGQWAVRGNSHGEKTQDLSDFGGLLRSGDRRPSMKAALGAWGADSNLFHQGAAKESNDPDVIAATMAKPGVVLRRPVGSDGSFGEHAELPTDLGDARRTKAAGQAKGRKAKKPSSREVDKAAEGKASLAYEREQKRRERERATEEAPGRRSVIAGSRRWTRRKRRLTEPRTSTRRRLRPSKPRWRLSRRDCEPKTPAGIRRRTD